MQTSIFSWKAIEQVDFEQAWAELTNFTTLRSPHQLAYSK